MEVSSLETIFFVLGWVPRRDRVKSSYVFGNGSQACLFLLSKQDPSCVFLVNAQKRKPKLSQTRVKRRSGFKVDRTTKLTTVKKPMCNIDLFAS